MSVTVFQNVSENDILRRRGLIALGQADETAASVNLASTNNPDFIRRPMRGIVVPKDTHASLTIVNSDRKVELYNTSSPVTGQPVSTTYNFLLQNVTETRNEKSQFITTFGATYAFFFGEQPRLISCTAVLPNSADFEWHKEWWENYSRSLRGTSLASSNSIAELTYADGRDSTVIRGYITNCTSMITAQDPYTIQVSFSMFVERLVRSPLNYEAPRRIGEQQDLLGVGALSSPEEQLRLDESSTASVRRTNIKLSPLGADPGALSKFVGALNAIDAAIDNTIRQARNFLYGRNMVIPVNYLAEGPPRNSLFAEGSGVESLQGLTLTNFFGSKILAFSNSPGSAKTVILRTNTDGELPANAILRSLQRTTRYYYQNTDEYVNYPVNSPTALQDLVDLNVQERDIARAETNALYAPQSVAAFAAFNIRVTPFPGPVVRDSASLERQSEAYYWANYAEQKMSEKLRIVGRAAFGVATFFIGKSVVNSRRRLQEGITNPNSGNLTANQRTEFQSSIARSQRNAEQERLVQESSAARLRGETGVIYPGTLGAVLSVIL
jgi:hypothetical protein